MKFNFTPSLCLCLYLCLYLYLYLYLSYLTILLHILKEIRVKNSFFFQDRLFSVPRSLPTFYITSSSTSLFQSVFFLLRLHTWEQTILRELDSSFTMKGLSSPSPIRLEKPKPSKSQNQLQHIDSRSIAKSELNKWIIGRLKQIDLNISPNRLLHR